MPYVGEIRAFTSELPRDWLPCDGRLLPVSQNNALFALIGTLYGGDGTSTFALPDLRGRAAAGADPGRNQRNGDTSGSGAEHPSLIPYAVARWGIAAFGDFPSRD